MDLDFFRERKSFFMAALVVLAMFSFVVLDSVNGCQRRGNLEDRAARTKVFQIGARPITEKNFEDLNNQRDRARGVVERLAQAAGDKANFELLPVVNFQYGQRPDFMTGGLRGVEDLLVLDAKAAELGIEVTRDEARNWIREFTSKSLSTAQLEAAFLPPKTKKPARGAKEGMAIDEFIDVMARELRAHRALEAIASKEDENAFTPLDIHRYQSDPEHAEIQLELCRIDAAPLIDPKAEPPAGALDKVYKEMKDVPASSADLPGVNPKKLAGLRRAPTAELEYIVVKPDALAAEVKIDDKRCRDFYEENKAEFHKLPPLPPKKPIPIPPPEKKPVPTPP